MKIIKAVAALALSTSLCLGATTPGSTGNLLVQAANEVVRAEAVVKYDSLNLDNSSGLFYKLDQSSERLAEVLQKNAGVFRASNAKLTSDEAQEIASIFNETASDVKTSTSHIIAISSKLRTTELDKNLVFSLRRLQGDFATLGEAVHDKLHNKATARSFEEISADLAAAEQAVSRAVHHEA